MSVAKTENHLSGAPSLRAWIVGYEFEHVVKSLSHDMSANFSLLESCMQRLRTSCDGHRSPDLLESVSHVEACLSESKLFLEDLAMLAKTGQIDMRPAVVSVARVVEDVLFELKGLLAERQVSAEIDFDLPCVWCNETRFRQVLGNLLRNAVLHGCDECNPRISISRCTPPAQSTHGEVVWLRVYDNGDGIPEEYREEVFRPGLRLPSATSPGTGMGLAIVKQIVSYYGGTVAVDRNCQNGTAFVLSLPSAPLLRAAT